jgi:hypothetical protein
MSSSAVTKNTSQSSLRRAAVHDRRMTRSTGACLDRVRGAWSAWQAAEIVQRRPSISIITCQKQTMLQESSVASEGLGGQSSCASLRRGSVCGRLCHGSPSCGWKPADQQPCQLVPARFRRGQRHALDFTASLLSVLFAPLPGTLCPRRFMIARLATPLRAVHLDPAHPST